MLLYPKKRDRHWRMQRATKIALCDRYYWEEYISEELLCSSSDYKRKVHSFKKEQKKALTQQLQVCQTRTREYAFGGSNPRHPD